MTCVKCKELCVNFKISSPSELRKAFDVVTANLSDGTLGELPSDSLAAMGQPAFQEAMSGATWPDFMNYKFACAHCGERFSLSAETYHGSGGSWQPEREAVIRQPP